MKRRPVNKHRAARKFGHSISKTHKFNVGAKPMRGGFRL